VADLHLEIVTPSRRLVETDVPDVYLPGAEGEVGILPEHAPLVSTMTPGVVRFSEKGTPRRLAVRSGFVHVLGNKVVLLADEAVLPEEVKPGELEKRRVEVDAKLVAADVDPEEREKLAQESDWISAQQAITS
jgi:F-type H+-transporting ATPase subunit epsilon